MTTRKIILLLSLTLFVALTATILRAQSDEPTAGYAQQESSNGQCGFLCRLREQQAQRLEGSWELTGDAVVPPGVPQPPSFHAYETFTHGGALIGSDRARPASKQHGTWAYLGGNKYAWTFKEDIFDAMGNFDGVLTIRFRATLTGKDEFVGVANSELRNANGDLIRNRCATGKGRRIMLEPLSEQCQSITPPR